MKRVLILKNLAQIAERADELSWEPLRKNVEIHWLYRTDDEGPAAALIRFQPGGRVDMHAHRGYEHIFVLSGSQTDQNGHLEAGSLMIHPPGTSHSIVSEEGCIVLAIYEKRVCFQPATA